MGFTITLAIIAVIISLFMCIAENPYKDKKNAEAVGVATALVCVVVGIILCGAIFTVSYSKYIKMMQQAVTIEQDAAAVKAYVGFGVTAFVMGQMASDELTDLKFGSYQKEMSRKIGDLKSQVKKYNQTLVAKKIMKKGWYWSWFIYLPDLDMATISMDGLLQVQPVKNASPEPAKAEPTNKDGGV